eukprot:TRINITY_DN14029_c0_g1_i3.p1 TRINITY_DN14029_c0_g1~~TRINITY_DN14029_c0_g1_i3.p1  ORF type:complete len:304 (-),score=57.17 TRINITY_DN14029_c0_g1_i3:385-1296(-)
MLRSYPMTDSYKAQAELGFPLGFHHAAPWLGLQELPLVAMPKEVDETPRVTPLFYTSRDKLLHQLKELRGTALDVHFEDVIDCVATVKGLLRGALMKQLLSCWFSQASFLEGGHKVHAVDLACHEETPGADSKSRIVVVRANLTVGTQLEDLLRSAATSQAELAAQVQKALHSALPLCQKEQRALGPRLQISWAAWCEAAPGVLKMGGIVLSDLMVELLESVGEGDTAWAIFPPVLEEFWPVCSRSKVCAKGDEYRAYVLRRNLVERQASYSLRSDGGGAVIHLQAGSDDPARFQCPSACSVQ